MHPFRRNLIALQLLAAAAIFGQSAATASDGMDLPEGKGKDEFVRQCQGCHDFGFTATIRYPRVMWQTVVADMLERANQPDDEAAVIAAYLARNYGKLVNVNKAFEKEIADGLALPLKDARTIVKHRQAKGDFKDLASLLKVPGIDAGMVREMARNISY